MKTRHVIVTIDSIAELLKDYVANPDDIPVDAMPVKMLFNPINKKLAVEFISESYTGSEAPLAVTFDIKRVFSCV